MFHYMVRDSCYYPYKILINRMRLLNFVNKILNTQKYTLSSAGLLKNSEQIMSEVAKYLKAAENTSFEGRKFTYARGGPGGVLPFREAADKSWVAISQVTDALVDHLLHKIPKGHYDRRLALKEIEAKWPEVASKNLYDRYGALTYYIRNNSNYYSTMDLELLKFEVDRLNKYIADVKSIVEKK